MHWFVKYTVVSQSSVACAWSGVISHVLTKMFDLFWCTLNIHWSLCLYIHLFASDYVFFVWINLLVFFLPKNLSYFCKWCSSCLQEKTAHTMQSFNIFSLNAAKWVNSLSVWWNLWHIFAINLLKWEYFLKKWK